MKFTISLVARLTHALQSKLSGSIFKESYSTGNHELILVFQQGPHIYSLRLLWEARACFVFCADEQLPKPTPHYSFFKELNGEVVQRIFQHPGNRSFQMDIGDSFQLVFKLYDGLSNVLLLQHNQLLYHFRKNISSDYAFTLAQLATHPAPPEEMQADEVPDFFEWLHEHNRKQLRDFAFEEEKRKLHRQLKADQKKTIGFIHKTEEALLRFRTSVSPEETGHILMANLEHIAAGAVSCELFDFYRNRSITVKLKKELNAQQNAEAYYRKAKNRKTEERLLTEGLAKAKVGLAQIESALQQLEHAQSLRDLKTFKKEGTATAKEKPEKFKQFQWEGYTIWVGKNAVNNDELTFKHSHKSDLWLHARDVSGSHVIIRQKQGAMVPRKVIEYAASLAAFYSKARGSSLVPVIYCERKFVRKPKGSVAGEVAVSNEQLVMAEPHK